MVVALAHTCLVGAAQGADVTAVDESFVKPLVRKFGEATLTTKAPATFGTVIRTETRDPEFVTPGNAGRFYTRSEAAALFNTDRQADLVLDFGEFVD